MYESSAPLFQSFVNSVERLKMKYDQSALHLSKILKNGLNSSYGCFMRKPYLEKNKICSTLMEFDNLLENENVTDFHSIGKDFLDVSFVAGEANKTNVFSNMCYGAHIISYSKMYLDMKITALKEQV